MSRVVVTGASGLLGRALVSAFRSAGHEVVPLTHADIDLVDPQSLRRITEADPDVVVNSAAWTDVDGCALDPDRAMRINGEGAGLVAAAAARADSLVVQISTNEVFDGEQEAPYDEDDMPNPINPYGASKLAGERAVSAATDRHLIVRTAWLFDAEHGFPARIRAAAHRAVTAGEPLRVVADERGNPTPVGPLSTAIAVAASRSDSGTNVRLLHVAGEPPTSRLEWSRHVLAGVPVELHPIARSEYSRPSRVPANAVLATQRARGLGLQGIAWTEPASTVEARA